MTQHGRFTLSAPAQLAQEIRKSRFLANAAPVETEPAAMEFLARVADRAATHNCWAWRIGTRYRFSDDGEPGGTAGRPILQVIDAQNLDQVMVVVTRWFGGIKLGTGGLVRAYGGCAAECLRMAGKTELIDHARVLCTVEFAVLARLRPRLHDLAATVQSESFDARGAAVTIRLPRARLADLRVLIADLTRGRTDLQPLD